MLRKCVHSAVFAREVTFAYQTGESTLSQCTAEIAQGQVICVCGPPGEGKNTLLQLLGQARAKSMVISMKFDE